MSLTLNDASARSDLEQVRRLLAAGADVRARETLSRTCLHLASEAGHADVLAALVAGGAEVGALE